MADTDPPTLLCPHGEVGPLTADPASPVWSNRAAISLRDVVTGAAPRQKTEARLAWDAEHLRVLYAVDDDHVVATLTERDAPLYTEEVVELFIDPVGDLESYFEFEINPLGTILDLVLRKSRSGYLKNFAWQCDGLQSMARRTDTGWIAELAIPFASIASESPMPGAVWRVNFARIDRPLGRERELTAWAPTGIANFHVPTRFGRLEFTA